MTRRIPTTIAARRRGVSPALAVFLLFMFADSEPVWSHGGVSFEDDVCVLKVGPFLMHFTGYLPSLQKNQEFCEDIPAIGPAIVVLDFVDKALRDMTVEFMIVRDVDNIGNSATYEDLGGPEAIVANMVVLLEPNVYPRGSIIVEHSFAEKGRFIGLLRVLPSGEDREFIAVFPFSVGLSPWIKWTTVLLVLIGITGLAYYIRRIWAQ